MSSKSSNNKDNSHLFHSNNSNNSVTSSSSQTTNTTNTTQATKSPATATNLQVTTQLKEEIVQSIIQNNLDKLKQTVHSEIVNIKDRSGNSLLHIATTNDKTEIAKWLIGQGANVNALCNSHSCLSISLQRGNFELFDFYLNDANADCSGRFQLNVLHEAALKNRIDLVEKLLEKQVDPNLYNNLHHTAITYAIQNKNIDLVLLLLENGACVNLPDKKGSTALHEAFRLLDSDIIKCLLDNTECDLKAKNVQEETCFDLYFINCIKESKQPDEEIIKKCINESQAQFSSAYLFEMTTSKQSLVLLKFLSLLLKHSNKNELLKDLLFEQTLKLERKQYMIDLILNCYWRNSIIIACKSIIYDLGNKNLKFDDSNENDEFELQVLNPLELIFKSNQFDLNEADICSTFHYLLNNNSSNSNTELDFVLVKFIKDTLSSLSSDEKKNSEEETNLINDRVSALC
jgi:ankyrin repeat protein